jgi:hypothetical protein
LTIDIIRYASILDAMVQTLVPLYEELEKNQLHLQNTVIPIKLKEILTDNNIDGVKDLISATMLEIQNEYIYDSLFQNGDKYDTFREYLFNVVNVTSTNVLTGASETLKTGITEGLEINEQDYNVVSFFLLAEYLKSGSTPVESRINIARLVVANIDLGPYVHVFNENDGDTSLMVSRATAGEDSEGDEEGIQEAWCWCQRSWRGR